MPGTNHAHMSTNLLQNRKVCVHQLYDWRFDSKLVGGGGGGFKFLLDPGPFYGATGTLCFGLLMTVLPVGFKASVDSLSPVFFCRLGTMSPRVISGCWDVHDTQ